MKIIHIITTLDKGGAQRLVIDICTQLEKRNIDYLLISLDKVNCYEYLTSKINLKIIDNYIFSLSISNKNHVELSKLTDCISEFKPDIIHTHLFRAEIISRWNLFPNVRYFTHLHDNMEQISKIGVKDFFTKQKLTNFFEKTILFNRYKKANNHFISISQHTNQFALRILPKKLRKNIHLLHNAIDVDRFTNKVLSEKESDTIKLVSIGLLVPKKNQIFQLKIVKKIIEKGYEVELIILGEGKQRENIQNKINSLNLQDKIVLEGNKDNVEEYLWKSTIYLHTALYEPLGLVLLEAMAAGIPVVCLNGQGNKDIIANGENGFIFDDQNSEMFANKIIELSKNDALYRHITKNALTFVKRFDISNYVDNLLNLYRL